MISEKPYRFIDVHSPKHSQRLAWDGGFFKENYSFDMYQLAKLREQIKDDKA